MAATSTRTTSPVRTRDSGADAATRSTGLATTSRVSSPRTPPASPTTVTVPGATSSSRPSAVTVATASFAEDHRTTSSACSSPAVVMARPVSAKDVSA